MNRIECRQIAEERLLAAQTLLAAGQWSSAYYLAGYAVECGLKACIFARVEREGVLFEDERFQRNCWTHDLRELVKLAGLDAARGLGSAADPVLATNWSRVEAWDERSRYRLASQVETETLIDAIGDPIHGVMQWVRIHW